MTTSTPSVPQLLLPGQAAAPEGPVQLAAMYLMHRGFRRDLELFAAVVPTVPVEDRDRWALIARRFAFFGTVLHKHHTGEDAAMWPLLAQRGADRAVLDALEAEHAGIDPLLATVAEELAALASGTGDHATRDRLAADTLRLRDALHAHLAHEERDGMAEVQQHLSQADWDRLDEVFAQDYGAREVPAMLGWVLGAVAAGRERAAPGLRPAHGLAARAARRPHLRRAAGGPGRSGVAGGQRI
jgi:hypothetical protein